MSLHLNDRALLREGCLIDGVWVGADSGESLEVKNPATGEVLGRVPNCASAETTRAIEAAATAQGPWAGRSAKARGALLRAWYEAILAHQEDLARLMTAEQGKPLAEARGEILYAASFIEWFAEEAKRLYGDLIPAAEPDKRLLVLRQPLGVVAAITPWNFPAAMLTRKVAPALAAGCTVVAKPAQQTPYSALALAELATRVGLPHGVLNVLTGDAEPIGRVLSAHPKVRKLTFTGSTAVGKKLMSACAGTLKKLSLELGGNAPFIVFEDADLEQAVAGALASKYRNSGQTCVCANRLLVQSGIYEAFAKRLTEAVRGLKVGDGLQGPTDQGPLIDEQALEKVETYLADALAKGARVRIGGQRHALGGTFYEPTVLTGATPAMRLAREEIFGPIAPIFRFESEAEAIELANASEYGLAAYLYTQDLARFWRVAEALQCGMVGVNTGLISTEVAPFGGWKESGLGREGSKYGLLEYTELKYVCVGGVNRP